MKRLMGVVLLAGCGMTPITNRLKPGEEALVVVVGEGIDGATDLFVAPAEGGQFHQLTFTRGAESLPKLSPSGTELAYIREGGDATAELVVFSMIGGSERALRLSGKPLRIGWFRGGDTVAVAGETGVTVVPVASGPLVAAAGSARADTMSYDRLGTPAFGSIRPCAAGGLCVRSDAGEETVLAEGAGDGCRWGDKALAYVRNGAIEVRPLGGGRVRQPTWTQAPAHLRQPTHHPGSDTR